MNCTHALKLIDLIVDGIANEKQRRLLRFHLMGCASCRAALKMTMSISELVRDISQPAPPEDLLDKVRARLDADDFPAVSPARSALKKYAIVLPFAAAVLLFISIAPLRRSGDVEDRGITSGKSPASYSLSKTNFSTSPFLSYSRPSTLTTF